MKKSTKNISGTEFDKKFDEGKDEILGYFDTKNIFIHNAKQRVNLEIPSSILKQIDEEAHRIGVARTALIKVWLSEKIEFLKHH